MHFKEIDLQILEFWTSGFPVSSNLRDLEIFQDDQKSTIGVFKVELTTEDLSHAPHIIHYVKNPKDTGNHDRLTKHTHLAILIHSPFDTVKVCFLKEGGMFGEVAKHLQNVEKTPNGCRNFLFITEMIDSESLGVQRVLKGEETIVGIANNFDTHLKKILN